MFQHEKSPRWRPRAFLVKALAIGVLLFTAVLTGCVSILSSATPSPSPREQVPSASAAPPTLGAASQSPSIDEAPHGFASRMVIPLFSVDLPVIAGLMDSEGNPEFPLCDVTQYLPFYSQPAEPGTTYLYAHARRGMLADMLAASEINEGASMIGQQVIVYTSGGWRHVYSISIVKRHATDYSLADDLQPDEQRLIVQTSEGPATDPLKLQVAATPVSAERVPLTEAVASPQPRECPPAQ